jgi:hypothetical protein
MDTSEPDEHKSESPESDGPSKGPSLILMYSLIALAMLLALGCAALIVLPFYERR